MLTPPTLLSPFIKDRYTPADLSAVWQFLNEKGTLSFEITQHQLFPAAAIADAQKTGYSNVWVRDNVYVAYAHYKMGDVAIAAGTLSGLMTYFKKVAFRFTDIIQTPALKEQVMRRPHIRFDGESLTEVDEDWEHAQNDALGYFLWLYCQLAMQEENAGGLLPLTEAERAVLLRFVAYFEAIRYWEDPDSGHWEEGRKVAASSIGAVVAGLRALRSLITNGPVDFTVEAGSRSAEDTICQLIASGEHALREILPWESRDPEHARRYDAALLFLIYPLQVVERSQAEAILSDVKAALMGGYGIQRYPYDSFWCKDFHDLDKSIQTAKYTGREAWLKEHNRAVRRGEEAQWCIFDPIVSAIYGEWFQASGEPSYLEQQTRHLNRALSQITGEGNTVPGRDGSAVEIPPYRCPELYYLQGDQYVPNVSTPLLWTQANMCLALKSMARSLAS
ncbi:MAG: glycoside hydrolase family 15 protein [Cyanobacteria bacterium J06614_10]